MPKRPDWERNMRKLRKKGNLSGGSRARAQRWLKEQQADDWLRNVQKLMEEQDEKEETNS